MSARPGAGATRIRGEAAREGGPVAVPHQQIPPRPQRRRIAERNDRHWDLEQGRVAGTPDVVRIEKISRLGELPEIGAPRPARVSFVGRPRDVGRY